MFLEPCWTLVIALLVLGLTDSQNCSNAAAQNCSNAAAQHSSLSLFTAADSAVRDAKVSRNLKVSGGICFGPFFSS